MDFYHVTNLQHYQTSKARDDMTLKLAMVIVFDETPETIIARALNHSTPTDADN